MAETQDMLARLETWRASSEEGTGAKKLLGWALSEIAALRKVAEAARALLKTGADLDDAVAARHYEAADAAADAHYDAFEALRRAVEEING